MLTYVSGMLTYADIASAVGYGAPVAGMPPPVLTLIKLTKPEETD